MPPIGNNGAGYSAIAPKQIMKIQVDYGDDHNGVDCREVEQKRWKRKEWDSDVFTAKPDFPTQYWASVYRKRNYLFEMNRFQDTMEITSIVQLGN